MGSWCVDCSKRADIVALRVVPDDNDIFIISKVDKEPLKGLSHLKLVFFVLDKLIWFEIARGEIFGIK